MKHKILIIVPAFNEENNIVSVISDILKHCPDSDIVVVNDGSGDNTVKLARQSKVAVLDLPNNLGIGAAMQTGYKFAQEMGYDFTVQCDGDGQHPANQINKILKPVISNEADLVVGSRYIQKNGYKTPLMRKAGMIVFTFVISLIIKQKASDTTSGFRAANRKVIKFFADNYPCDYPEVEALVYAHKANFRITEVPVEMRQRAAGVSSINHAKSAYYMTKVLLAVFLDMFRNIRRA